MYEADAGYEFEIDSDQERAESSEDEITMWLHGTPEQKRKVRRRSLGKASSSEDEFEKQMETELSATMDSLEAERQTGPSTSKPALEGNKEEKEFYDDIYFSSDSDTEEKAEKKEKTPKKKHPMPTNDELLYDPNMDDDDQKWVDNKRRNYSMSQSLQKKPGKQKPLPNSDAVLNCPACLCTLCLDCQRHFKFKNQYRAMFVQNCNVDKTELLKFPKEEARSKKRGKGKKRRSEEVKVAEVEEQPELYHPVRCTECNTQVGVFDAEEIFHFFNVLESYG